MSLVVVGAAGFFMWKYLKKRQTKNIAKCLLPEGGSITLESVIASLPKFEKGEAKGWEMKRYTECKNNNKLLA